MGQVFYRKYRSRSLDEIVGQSHITDMLRRAIQSERIAHAYLLTGPRGVGKTSIARILAHEINRLPYTDESTHLDIIEIDAASNNSVEDIRDLRDKVQIAPTSAPFKVYIIDEVHMLSKPAFNALLKTLEEPPRHVVFILATTDVEKLPATILSRVQRFNFRAAHPDDIVVLLRKIADAEDITIDDDTLRIIAHHGQGSFRDSTGLLDQLRHVSDGAVTKELVANVLGLASDETVNTLIDAHITHDAAAIVTTLTTVERLGTPAPMITEQLIDALRGRVLGEPHLLPLLDALLDVTKSQWPYVKLLTALYPSTPQAETTDAPNAPVAAPVVVAPSSTKKPASTAAQKPAKKPEEATPAVAPILPPLPPSSSLSTASEPFDWQRFVEHVKQESAGAATILRSCGYHSDGHTLTIYAGKKFPKTQLDKSLNILAKALQLTGIQGGEIIILAEAAPPSNSQTAAILDMMGGGEEVTI